MAKWKETRYFLTDARFYCRWGFDKENHATLFKRNDIWRCFIAFYEPVLNLNMLEINIDLINKDFSIASRGNVRIINPAVNIRRRF